MAMKQIPLEDVDGIPSLRKSISDEVDISKWEEVFSIVLPSMNLNKKKSVAHHIKNKYFSILNIILILLAMLLSLTTFNHAEAQESSPSPEVERVRLALAGDDANEKKTAIRAISKPDVGTDEQVIPLLVFAIDDRQGGESAVIALIARTGQTPLNGEWKNNTRRTRLAWNNWFEKWKQGQQIKNLEKKFDRFSRIGKNIKPQTSIKQSAVEGPEITKIPKTPIVAGDQGKLYRVVFKSGGTLLCYVKSSIVDAQGTLISVRVIHPEGAGEEIIPGDLISRIDDVNE